MKKLLCLFASFAFLFSSINVFAEGNVIKANSLTEKEKSTLTSTVANANLLLTEGNVKMLKSVSGDFLILTFSDTEGFGNDVYNSIIEVLSVILSDTHLSYFKGKYPSISTLETVSFAGFRVRMNPAKLSIEKQYFDNDTSILRVEVCLTEFDDIPNQVVPTPSITPTPDDNDVTNPSTLDIEPVSFILCTVISLFGLAFSIRKIITD